VLLVTARYRIVAAAMTLGLGLLDRVDGLADTGRGAEDSDEKHQESDDPEGSSAQESCHAKA
jgi:hypothetical protein